MTFVSGDFLDYCDAMDARDAWEEEQRRQGNFPPFFVRPVGVLIGAEIVALSWWRRLFGVYRWRILHEGCDLADAAPAYWAFPYFPSFAMACKVACRMSSIVRAAHGDRYQGSRWAKSQGIPEAPPPDAWS